MADSALFAKKNYLDPAIPENTEKIQTLIKKPSHTSSITEEVTK